MSRHELGKLPSKLPTNNRQKITIKPVSTVAASGIVGQVRKVSAEIGELRKSMAVESAARNELKIFVEQLKNETVEAKQNMDVAVKDGSGKRRNSGKELLLKRMPCKTLDELDWLLSYTESRSSQWLEYLKMLGGSDFSSAIKIIINSIMQRSLQSLLSWSGQNTKKPSFKTKYKGLIDGIHIAMKDLYKDYTIVHGEAKMQSMLRNAAAKSKS